MYLRRRYYEITGCAASGQGISDARNTLESLAHFEGQAHPVHVRVAEHVGAVYVDLCDETWRAAEITPHGWRIVERPPIRFVRKRGMLPLPTPIHGGTVANLRRLINADDDTDWTLLAAWLVGAFAPRGPYPVLALHGEQGSGKSTVSRMLRALVDPNSAPIRAEPRDAHELMIAASNSWVVALDNLSRVTPWLSDGLCRLATGGGFSARELYSNSSETIFEAQRPVILNGIEDVATRGDLLSRAIVVRLPSIPESRRSTESDLWRSFYDAAPSLLGALFGAVACAMRRLSQVTLPGLPRMADFARWATAAEPALGLDEGAVMRAYDSNRATVHELALEGSPIVPVLRAMVDEQRWSATATELLAELTSRSDDAQRRLPGWPKAPKTLAGQLRRLAPNLRATGLEATELPRESQTGRRLWGLRALPKTPSRESLGSLPVAATGDGDGLADLVASSPLPSVGDGGVDGHPDPRKSDIRVVAEIGAGAKVATAAGPA